MSYNALTIVDNTVGAADDKILDGCASCEFTQEAGVVVCTYVDIVEPMAAPVKSSCEVPGRPGVHLHVYVGAEARRVRSVGRVAQGVPCKKLRLGVDNILPPGGSADIAGILAAVADEGLDAGGGAGAGKAVGADQCDGEASRRRRARQDGGVIVAGSEGAAVRLQLHATGGLERLGERSVGVNSGRACQIGPADNHRGNVWRRNTNFYERNNVTELEQSLLSFGNAHNSVRRGLETCGDGLHRGQINGQQTAC